MPKPRKALVLLEEAPYYHCVSRCLRRAFLCVVDSHTGKSYEHRRQWIVDRLKQLTVVFAIDICAYAVMSNHYHVILHVDTQCAAEWNEQEVIARWERLFSLPVLVQGCWLCPGLGDFEDIDNQIDYVADFINEQN